MTAANFCETAHAIDARTVPSYILADPSAQNKYMIGDACLKGERSDPMRGSSRSTPHKFKVPGDLLRP